MIETGRLRIHAATQGEMETFIELQAVDALKTAYQEMLDGCLQHPDEWEWHAIWMIELRDRTHIGELCFKGIDEGGIAEIGYGISPEYQRKGYATEAVSAVSDWAFQNGSVTAIEAETEDDNEASKRVLAKCGFVANGKRGEEGTRYVLIRK